MFAAETILEQHRDDLPIPTSMVYIRSEAIKKIIDKYPNVFKNRDDFRLPGTLLICRRELIRNNAQSLCQIMEALRSEFIKRLSGKTFEYRDYQRDFDLDIPKKDIKIEEYHDLNETVFLSKKEVRSLIYFTRYLREELGHKDIVNRELIVNDFLPIVPVPRGWREIALGDIKDRLYDTGSDIVMILQEFVKHLQTHIRDDSLFVKITKEMGVLSNTNEKIGNEAGSRHEANSLRFLIVYQAEEIMNNISDILRVDDNYEKVNEKISISDFEHAIIYEIKQMEQI